MCDDRTDSQKVQKAAEEYRKYAELLPKDDEVDGIFMNELHELYAHYRPSESYIDRIVRRRIGSISPEFINENDTTRLLILKQFFPQEYQKELLLKLRLQSLDRSQLLLI